MKVASWTIFLVCRTAKRFVFMFYLNYFLMKQYCIFIYFLKKRCQRLKVKGKLREKRIKLKVSNGRRWRWWNAWDLITYNCKQRFISEAVPFQWLSEPTHFNLSNKNALNLCNGGPLMARPFGLWMNAKSAHLKANLLSKKDLQRRLFPFVF